MESARSGRLGIRMGTLALVLATAPAANAHRLAASGAGVCWDGELCFDTHLEGHGEVGVPGVNPDFAHFDTSVNSDTGHLSIFGAFRWIEGNTRPATGTHFDDFIEEGVVLERIAAGPVTLRATLRLQGDGTIEGPSTSIRLLAEVSLGGCGITATKNLYATVDTEWERTGQNACAEIVGSSLVVTSTYDGDLPTTPMVTARIQSDSFGLFKGTVFDYGYEADLEVEILNATAIWDTPSFLTQAPEPEGDALGLSSCGAIGMFAMRKTRARRQIVR